MFLALQVQQGNMWAELAAAPIEVTINTNNGGLHCKLPYLDQVAADHPCAWGSYNWAAASNALRRALLDAVDATVSSNIYLDHMLGAFAEAIAVSHDLRPQRFDSIQTLLHCKMEKL